MLPENTLKSLEDIRHAANLILEYARGHTLRKYKQNSMFRDAIERRFLIIGEALNRIHKSDPDTAQQITDCPRIIAFRNFLAHGYDKVDHEVSWMIVEKELPVLLDEVVGLLPAEPPDIRLDDSRYNESP